MPYHSGDRVEAFTVCGRVPAVVVAVYPAGSAGRVLYAVEPDEAGVTSPRLVLDASHLRARDLADTPFVVTAGGDREG